MVPNLEENVHKKKSVIHCIVSFILLLSLLSLFRFALLLLLYTYDAVFSWKNIAFYLIISFSSDRDRAHAKRISFLIFHSYMYKHKPNPFIIFHTKKLAMAIECFEWSFHKMVLYEFEFDQDRRYRVELCWVLIALLVIKI